MLLTSKMSVWYCLLDESQGLVAPCVFTGENGSTLAPKTCWSWTRNRQYQRPMDGIMLAKSNVFWTVTNIARPMQYCTKITGSVYIANAWYGHAICIQCMFTVHVALHHKIILIAITISELLLWILFDVYWINFWPLHQNLLVFVGKGFAYTSLSLSCRCNIQDYMWHKGARCESVITEFQVMCIAIGASAFMVLLLFMIVVCFAKKLHVLKTENNKLRKRRWDSDMQWAVGMIEQNSWKWPVW